MTETKRIIFIIDDDMPTVQTMGNALADLDCKVYSFTSPSDVLNHPRLKEVDLFIIDLVLGGSDGRDLYKEIGSLGIDKPALFVSDTLDDTAFKGLDCTCVYDFMPKPFPSIKIFINRVKLLLNFSYKIHEKEKETQIEAQKLALSEEKFRTLFANAGDALFFMDIDSEYRTRFVECNQRTLNLFGCESSDVIGKGPEFFSPEFQPDGQSSIEKATELTKLVMEGQPQDFMWLHHRYDNKKPFWVEVNLTQFTLEGRPSYMQAVVRDVTVRVEAEKEKERISTLFEAVLEQAPFGIDIIEKNGKWRVVKSSNKSKDITGEPNLEMLGDISMDACGFDIYSIDGGLVDIKKLPGIRSFLTDEHVENEELVIIRRDGSEVYVAFKSVPVKDKHGKTIAGLQISFDITERKANEDLLRERFAASVNRWKDDTNKVQSRTQKHLKELTGAINKLETRGG